MKPPPTSPPALKGHEYEFRRMHRKCAEIPLRAFIENEIDDLWWVGVCDGFL